MKAVLGERRACRQFGLNRATVQRRDIVRTAVAIAAGEGETNAPRSPVIARQVERLLARREAKATRSSKRALDKAQRKALLDAVHEPRFTDRSVPAIFATLLEEDRYYGSISTMYRVLRSVGEVGERRDQATRPAHVKPELWATAPNQVWTWDITKFHGPAKWKYFYLYAIIDIKSRYVVGWMVADRESSELAKTLIAETLAKYQIPPGTLTIHADRGSSMTSKPVAFLLADLGVTKSHSRPHVSDDNPFVESLFKTTKYMPQFPATFANLAEARAFCVTFFDFYNNQHRHSGIALLTPFDVHFGHVEERTIARQCTLDAAYAAHPERFVRGRPKAPTLAPVTYINRPDDQTTTHADAA